MDPCFSLDQNTRQIDEVLLTALHASARLVDLVLDLADDHFGCAPRLAIDSGRRWAHFMPQFERLGNALRRR
jgi:hypothetical protein